MDGDTLFMKKQYDGSNQEKHYSDDLINGGNETVGDTPNGNEESSNNLSEQIIKNIAVEKELSEIASAYNLHRTESDVKTDDLAMDIDSPRDFKEACAFGSDKSGVSDHLSETSETDSQGAAADIIQATNESNLELVNDHNADEKNEDAYYNQGVKEKELVETIQYVEENSKTRGESIKHIKESSKHVEENSKDLEDNVKDVEENSKDLEDNVKDVEVRSKDIEENGKDLEVRSTDVEDNDKDVEVRSKDVEDNGKDVKVRSNDVEDNGKNVEVRSKDVEDNGKDVEARSNDVEESSKDIEEASKIVKEPGENIKDSVKSSQEVNESSLSMGVENEEGEEETDEEDVVLCERQKVKEEYNSDENEDEVFLEGMCAICKDELNTSNHALLNKHLSDNHVNEDGDEFKCGVCQNDYSERRGAVRHLLNAHLHYRPHKCSLCPKSFARKDHLARHEKLHEADFQCKYCDICYNTKDKLDKHMLKMHRQKGRKVVKKDYEEDDDVITLDNDSVASESSAQDATESDDSVDFLESYKRKTRRPPKRAAKRPKRGRPPKKIKIEVKREDKTKQRKMAKKEKEREEKRKKKEEEERRKVREKELREKKKQRQKMLEEEQALERLREREKARKERQEREEAKERQLKEELQKKLEETMRKQKELDEHYYDGNFIEPATTPLKEVNNVLDEFSINYTNFYGGNYHEPPKKTLAQLEVEKNLLAGYEAFQGLHFLTDPNAPLEAKVKSEHITMINPDAPQGVCGLCGEEYEDSDPQALSKHIYEKHIDNAASDKKCAICGKEYSERKGLNRHMLHYHLNFKPHRCTFCTKSFSRRDHLTRHLAQHTDKNKYVCEFCEKCFTRKEHLTRHLWVHKDTFKFKCLYCTKAYTKDEHLDRHVKEVHFVHNKTQSGDSILHNILS